MNASSIANLPPHAQPCSITAWEYRQVRHAEAGLDAIARVLREAMRDGIDAGSDDVSLRVLARHALMLGLGSLPVAASVYDAGRIVDACDVLRH